MLAAAALALVGLAPTASADGTATIYPIPETVTFVSSNDAAIDVDYTCSVPTDANDALAVRLVQADGAAFVGGTWVTCDGTRHSAVVDIAGEGPAGQLVQVGPGRIQLSLQGTQLEQDVTIVRPDNEPHPPVVTPLIEVQGDVVFTTATQGSVTLVVQCNNWADGVSVSVQGEDKATGDVGIACAQERIVVVPLTAQGTGFRVGTQRVQLEAQSIDSLLATEVDLVRQGPPEPVKASLSLTANASPGKVTKGKKITVKGKARREGKKVKVTTALEFRPDGGHYAKIKSVTSSSKGSLKTTVRASRSGSFRFTFAGNATTKPGASAGDHLRVVKRLPKPKRYKNCTALVKVYPHGVGRSGAHDKGGDVTDFTRDNKTYAKNKKSDRDKDGIACER